jgi:hypothetical protein
VNRSYSRMPFQTTMLGTFALSVAGCTMASSGSGSSVATAMQEEGEYLCQVLIENATSETLELNYQTRTQRVPVGLADPGSSHTVSVPCNSTRFWVQGRSIPETGYDQVRKGAQLVAGEEALVRLTEADRIRPRGR